MFEEDLSDSNSLALMHADLLEDEERITRFRSTSFSLKRKKSTLKQMRTLAVDLLHAFLNFLFVKCT